MRLAPGLVAVAALLAMAGCGGGSTSSAPSTATTSGSSVAVTESEYSITLPSNTMKVGSYTFKVTNKGQFAHNLTVDGPGVKDKATPTLSPGSSGDVTVNLRQGTYEFYCSIDSHKDKGMDDKVQVS
ncbi:MAG TPA: plastocyanin/azurin family copper-binding protein [Propionibacteriaceae bacterium]|nr:plastocyanin/azurin family copper-binding protein [Propionibacteriaceae bacterium]